MKKRLRHVAPLQCGIVLATLYALVSLVFVPVVLVVAVFGNLWRGGARHSILNGIFVVLFPVFYGVIGFILGVIVAAVYNLAAKWTGGLEFETTDLRPKT
jgi:hypothetical protein